MCFKKLRYVFALLAESIQRYFTFILLHAAAFGILFVPSFENEYGN